MHNSQFCLIWNCTPCKIWIRFSHLSSYSLRDVLMRSQYGSVVLYIDIYKKPSPHGFTESSDAFDFIRWQFVMYRRHGAVVIVVVFCSAPHVMLTLCGPCEGWPMRRSVHCSASGALQPCPWCVMSSKGRASASWLILICPRLSSFVVLPAWFSIAKYCTQVKYRELLVLIASSSSKGCEGL